MLCCLTGFSFSREKAMATKLGSMIVTVRFSEKTNDFIRLQNIASAWYSFECYLVLTCCSKILGKSKWMITWFDLQTRWLKAD